MKVRQAAASILVTVGIAGVAPLMAQTPAAQPAATVRAGAASAPGAAMAVRTVKTTATVVGIDAATRKVTLKGQDGKVFDITAGEEVRNFAQIAIGDKVTAEYVQALTLELKKGGAGVVGSSQKESSSRTALGTKPGGAVARQTTILANVVAIDAQKKTVTLRGPAGNMVDLAVQDPEQLKNIKKGDQVEAVYTEALAVAVEAAPAK
jgi:Cu/Ag efflux protein CusF